MIAGLRAWRRRRVEADPLLIAWADFHAGRPVHGGRHRHTSPAEVRPHLPMPGPEFTRDGALMACYDRLWRAALVRAERKLHGAVLP